MSKKIRNDDNNKIATGLSLISQFAIYMLVPIAGMSAGGYFLDRHFGTNWIFIVCFFVGAIAGGQNVYRLAMKIARQKSPEPERNIINRRTKKDDRVPEEKKPDPARAEDGNSGTGDHLSDSGHNIL